MFCPSISLVAIVAAAALPAGFAVSFQAGSRDDAGRFMGGTEMRVLAAHAGKLFAGNGYWEDTPGPEGRQGSQILILDAPGARWQVDHDFDERQPDGRRRDLAVSALDEVRFATDGNGKPLSAPVSLLIAANWDLGGSAQVFSRDDATGAWTAATLAQDQPVPGFLPQVRSFGRHHDQVTRGSGLCRTGSARRFRRRLRSGRTRPYPLASEAGTRSRLRSDCWHIG